MSKTRTMTAVASSILIVLAGMTGATAVTKNADRSGGTKTCNVTQSGKNAGGNNRSTTCSTDQTVGGFNVDGSTHFIVDVTALGWLNYSLYLGYQGIPNYDFSLVGTVTWMRSGATVATLTCVDNSYLYCSTPDGILASSVQTGDYILVQYASTTYYKFLYIN